MSGHRPYNITPLPPMRTALDSPPFSHRTHIMAASPSPLASKQLLPQPPTLPGIHELLTPPNSGNTGDLKHTFSEAEHEGDSMFPHDAAPMTTPSSQPSLFPPPRISPELERKLEEEERQYIRTWMEQRAPTWEDWERTTGLPRPSENEYELTWSFVRTFHQAVDDEKPQLTRTLQLTINEAERQQQQQQPPQKRRKVLQDTSPNRRGTTSIAPKLPASAPQPVRPKPASLRAPQSRKRTAKYSEDGSPEPRSKAARAKATKPETSHNFSDYPDWTPKAFEVPNAMQHAQAVRRFSGGYNDLSNDPHRHLLLPEEVEVAEHLSLNGAKYTCAKRQIFKGYVEHLAAKARAAGQDRPYTANWNKTAVQQLGNVDVNKMSALYTFFRDAGWFKEHLFAGYVDELLRSGAQF